jgi:DNA-binding transcriptional ArsR family regulator
MKHDEAVTALASLAQGTRLEIYRLLVKRGPEGYAPGELSEKLEIPSPTLSFHLKGLQQAKLITVRRDGRFLYYAANFPEMDDLVSYLTENCCGLADDACARECRPAANPTPKRKRA